MSMFGGLGVSIMNSLTPAALSAQGAAIDRYLQDNEMALNRGATAIEGDKNRRAQKEAQKRQIHEQHKLFAKNLGVTLGTSVAAPALIGGIAGSLGGGLAAGGLSEAANVGSQVPAAVATPAAEAATGAPAGMLSATNQAAANAINAPTTGSAIQGINQSLGSISGGIPQNAGYDVAGNTSTFKQGGYPSDSFRAATQNISPTPSARYGGGMPTQPMGFGRGMVAGLASQFAPGVLQNNPAFNPIAAAHLGLYDAQTALAIANINNVHANSEKTRALIAPSVNHLNSQAFQAQAAGASSLAQAGNYDASAAKTNAMIGPSVDAENALASDRNSNASASDMRAGLYGAQTNQVNALTGPKAANLGAEAYRNNAAGDNYYDQMSNRDALTPYHQDLMSSQAGMAQSHGNLFDIQADNAMLNPLGSGRGPKLSTASVGAGIATPGEVRSAMGLPGEAPFSPAGDEIDRRLSQAANDDDREKIYRYAMKNKEIPMIDQGRLVKKHRLSGY